MRIVLTGSRDWVKRGPVIVLMHGFAAHDQFEQFVFGDCPTGLDMIAYQTCQDLGYPYRQFKADWTAYGKAAGPRRNGEMVRSCRQGDVCYGFRTDGISAGTDDCLEQARNAGLSVYLLRSLPPYT